MFLVHRALKQFCWHFSQCFSQFLEAAESLLLQSSSMLKIDMINVMDKLLKIIHHMEHSRSQLKTYISRISFSRGRLFFGLVYGLSLHPLVLVFSSVLVCLMFNKHQLSSVQFNPKFKKFNFSVTFKFTLPLVPIKLLQISLTPAVPVTMAPTFTLSQ